MNPANVFVHRVASVEEVRALESIGVGLIGISLLKNPALADGRSLTVPEASYVLTAVRDAQVVVECDPEDAFQLPLAAHRGAFLWSSHTANYLLMSRAAELGYKVMVGPVALRGFFDLRFGPPLVPGQSYEYQVDGGDPGALGNTLTNPGIFNEVRKNAAEITQFIGFDVAPKTVGLAQIALGSVGLIMTLGHPRVPPAERHHLSLGLLFDTLGESGFSVVPDSDLSRLEAADIARRQRGRLEFAKAEARAAGKEPFDLARFGALYDLTRDNTAGLAIERQLERWEERYYLQAKHVKTLAAFADHYRELETYR